MNEIQELIALTKESISLQKAGLEAQGYEVERVEEKVRGDTVFPAFPFTPYKEYTVEVTYKVTKKVTKKALTGGKLPNIDLKYHITDTESSEFELKLDDKFNYKYTEET